MRFNLISLGIAVVAISAVYAEDNDDNERPYMRANRGYSRHWEIKHNTPPLLTLGQPPSNSAAGTPPPPALPLGNLIQAAVSNNGEGIAFTNPEEGDTYVRNVEQHKHISGSGKNTDSVVQVAKKKRGLADLLASLRTGKISGFQSGPSADGSGKMVSPAALALNFPDNTNNLLTRRSSVPLEKRLKIANGLLTPSEDGYKPASMLSSEFYEPTEPQEAQEAQEIQESSYIPNNLLALAL
ncbi:uncharacterized protein BYT42DRAFT_564878 [Radiomyces spectabilis]|uniref:uncharacterized protein n=1 Tax=Radiomyces spectabilis TaxID=64574 RepID=UPI00221FFE3C|nr:uncharacterized protein BYT42DRAFT_564878 [Radiomyces spectabilis]KAI8380994.1 hypothetical protein BYT42DRAFT_564878 [Radiomyces spectabilis]